MSGVKAWPRRGIRALLDRVDPTLKLEITRKVAYNRSGPAVWLEDALQRRALRLWLAGARQGPPPALEKQRVIRAYARQTGVRVFIETGTFLGDNIYRLRNDFDRIISIELDPRLARDARLRFARFSHISILEGDSSRILPDILNQLSEPAIFWLDAHWSGGVTGHGPLETPISEELDAILRHNIDRHVVLIDDARLLGVRPDYPTLAAICATVQRERPSWMCHEADGIVRLHSSNLIDPEARD